MIHAGRFFHTLVEIIYNPYEGLKQLIKAEAKVVNNKR
ncbi:hypothetical protein M595_1312 [Lyngbya aestuarii BL J]|uniref:Uncharacterized protein n=1 Tax=Lyngbya aestuarii BL J TaxID=1348334 RepID=U7QNJ4_9CYAN|nr:hypothetical protein M595_1312 [Lyngbya aestuarii BL J]